MKKDKKQFILSPKLNNMKNGETLSAEGILIEISKKHHFDYIRWKLDNPNAYNLTIEAMEAYRNQAVKVLSRENLIKIITKTYGVYSVKNIEIAAPRIADKILSHGSIEAKEKMDFVTWWDKFRETLLSQHRDAHHRFIAKSGYEAGQNSQTKTGIDNKYPKEFIIWLMGKDNVENMYKRYLTEKSK